VHGEVDIDTEAARYSAATLAALPGAGREVAVDGADVRLTVPVTSRPFNPDLVSTIHSAPLLKGYRQ